MRQSSSRTSVIAVAERRAPESWTPVEEFLALLDGMMTEAQEQQERVHLTALADEIQRETKHLPQPPPEIVRAFLARFAAPQPPTP